MNARRPSRLVAVILLSAAIAACDGGPTSGNALQPERSLYAAALTLDGRVGIFRVQEGGVPPVDLLEAGALVEIRFENDRTIAGRLVVPEGVSGLPGVDVEFGGTWSEPGGAVRVAPTSGSFLGELEFAVEPGRLVADGTVDGRRFEVELETVASTDPSLIEPGFPILEVVDVSFPTNGEEAWGEAVVESAASRTLAVALQSCAAFLRLRPDGEETVVWDQTVDEGCDAPRRLMILAPGESATIRGPVFDAVSFHEANLRGVYDVFVVFPVDGEEIEREVPVTFVGGGDG